jgi:hypothetical protein
MALQGLGCVEQLLAGRVGAGVLKFHGLILIIARFN